MKVDNEIDINYIMVRRQKTSNGLQSYTWKIRGDAAQTIGSRFKNERWREEKEGRKKEEDQSLGAKEVKRRLI